MAAREELSELVGYLARQLVDAPDQVAIDVFDEDRSLVFELRVAEPDLGKVIGRQGRTARAMRTVLSAAASRLNTRALLDIVE